ncbi:MAG: hypothetical protein JOY58_12935 [Solirubrobacterales bacterium]|nr:hypothetical protein [Solirubrobacterales bacterium]MBV9049172.1 hypothetical protein [Solirubrobacterales bacterium]
MRTGWFDASARPTSSEVLAFLHDLEDSLAVFLAELEHFTKATAFAYRHPPLAPEHGIAVHGASLRWTQHTTATLSENRAHD